jgi:hypothetical protein
MDDGDGGAISTSVEKKELRAQMPLITQRLRPDLKPASSKEAAFF